MLKEMLTAERPAPQQNVKINSKLKLIVFFICKSLFFYSYCHIGDNFMTLVRARTTSGGSNIQSVRKYSLNSSGLRLET